MLFALARAQDEVDFVADVRHEMRGSGLAASSSCSARRSC
jgi:hypothetical protein